MLVAAASGAHQVTCVQLLPTSLHVYVSSRATADGQHTDFAPTLSEAKLLQDWIDSTAEFLKSLDSNHLITVGSEGFLGSSTPGKNLLVPSIASSQANLVDSMPHRHDAR